MERQATVQVVSRSDFNPSFTVGIMFTDIDELVKKVDQAIDDAEFHKVECVVFDNGQFSEEELEKLDEELFIIE